jgi:hypothetical protein
VSLLSPNTVCDEWLWKRLCERDFTPIKNALASYFGKNWRWVYRSKVVVFKGRGMIKDGDVGTLITKDGRYEGEWYARFTISLSSGLVCAFSGT